MPENVECPTCFGRGYVVTDLLTRCPDCTPENVECRACEGKRRVWAGPFGQLTHLIDCPRCTPENVEEL